MNSNATTEFADVETCDEVTKFADAYDIKWSLKTIEAFRRHFHEFENDVSFDKFDIRLVKKVRAISADQKLYCVKCFEMRMLKKHGKVKSSYQFDCDNHKT